MVPIAVGRIDRDLDGQALCVPSEVGHFHGLVTHPNADSGNRDVALPFSNRFLQIDQGFCQLDRPFDCTRCPDGDFGPRSKIQVVSRVLAPARPVLDARRQELNGGALHLRKLPDGRRQFVPGD
jgi:hypothetical protein